MRSNPTARRGAALLAAGLIGLLAGCGQSDDSGDGARSATTTADRATASTSTASSQGSEPAASAGSDAPAATSDTSPAAETSSAAGEAAADGPVAEACSTDGSPTELDPLDTAIVPVAVNEASSGADNPLPDLTLRRVNCNPGFVNLKNEFPTDKPVLFWFWAPF